MTRYQMIKNMSLEELAELFSKFDIEKVSVSIGYCSNHCPVREQCEAGDIDFADCYDLEYKDCMKVWLGENTDEQI